MKRLQEKVFEQKAIIIDEFVKRYGEDYRYEIESHFNDLILLFPNLQQEDLAFFESSEYHKYNNLMKLPKTILLDKINSTLGFSKNYYYDDMGDTLAKQIVSINVKNIDDEELDHVLLHELRHALVTNYTTELDENDGTLRVLQGCGLSLSIHKITENNVFDINSDFDLFRNLNEWVTEYDAIQMTDYIHEKLQRGILNQNYSKKSHILLGDMTENIEQFINQNEQLIRISELNMNPFYIGDVLGNDVLEDLIQEANYNWQFKKVD